jgi:hypothetical protein
MKHANGKFDHIQDPSGKIPADEPVFLLRGQDAIAPTAVRIYAQRAGAAGASPEFVKAAEDQADAMDQWQKEHGGKTPDL